MITIEFYKVLILLAVAALTPKVVREIKRMERDCEVRARRSRHYVEVEYE